MTHQIFLTFFLLLTAFVQGWAQQSSTNRSTERAGNVSQVTNAADDFEYQLFRFRTAIEENDQESTDDIKVVLLSQIDRFIAESGLAQTAPEYKTLTGIRSSVDRYAFPAGNLLEPVMQKHLLDLQAFHRMIKKTAER